MIGLIKAKELHGRHPGLDFPIDMENVADLVDCICVDWSFEGQATEVKRSRWIGLAVWLDKRERRRLIAHAIGHHLLHCGNQLYLYIWQKPTVGKQEREAEEFAAHFLIPEKELDRVSHWQLKDIAEHFGVPVDFLWRRLTVYSTQEELRRWQAQSQEI